MRSKNAAGLRNAARRRPRQLRLDPARLAGFQRRLLRWYARHGRDLPWRRTRDPYEVLVSEIMLQQTQVRRVLEFYPRFLARYPTVEELAAARAGEVREAWRGLGYYRRADNLWRTARVVAKCHGGRFPSEPADLVALPGIGRYTAGAVASFAFGMDAAILDTNAARVLGRVFGPGRAAGRVSRLWAIAEAAIPRGRCYAFNQAIMDLGATLCTARRPACPRCPVRPVCVTYARAAACAPTRRAQR